MIRKIARFVLLLMIMTFLSGCLHFHHSRHHRHLPLGQAKKLKHRHKHGHGCGHVYVKGRWVIIAEVGN